MKKESSQKKKSKRNAVLDKLGNIDSSTKKLIQSEKTEIVDESQKKSKRKSKTVTTDTEFLYLPIYDSDSKINKILKEEINKREITKEFVYKRLQELYNLEEAIAENTGYNMIYTAKKGVEISAKRQDMWFDILGLEDIEIGYTEPSPDLMSSITKK